MTVHVIYPDYLSGHSAPVSHPAALSSSIGRTKGRRTNCGKRGEFTGVLSYSPDVNPLDGAASDRRVETPPEAFKP